MSEEPALIVWLGEILDQDEAVADDGRLTKYGCTPRRWLAGDKLPGSEQQVIVSEWTRADGQVRRDSIAVAGTWDDALAICHLGDPRAALARIDSHRAILADYQALVDEHTSHQEQVASQTDAEMHADFAHPHYEYATTEGPRKTWDEGASLPPADPATGETDLTWERNVDAGDRGWERFDVHEESYWRRLLPEDQWRGPFFPPIPRHIKHLAVGYAHRDGYQEEWRP